MVRIHLPSNIRLWHTIPTCLGRGHVATNLRFFAPGVFNRSARRDQTPFLIDDILPGRIPRVGGIRDDE
jgi:hypothetical protein